MKRFDSLIQSKSFSIVSFRRFFFASPFVDKVVAVRESLKTWVGFLTACIQRGLSNIKQSCAMGSPSEIDAPLRPPKYFSFFSIRLRDV